MEGDLTSGGEHTIQYTANVLQNCIPETLITLLINVTPINSIENKFQKGLKKAMKLRDVFLKRQAKLANLYIDSLRKKEDSK